VHIFLERIQFAHEGRCSSHLILLCLQQRQPVLTLFVERRVARLFPCVASPDPPVGEVWGGIAPVVDAMVAAPEHSCLSPTSASAHRQ
jgi:hypothetical protein